MAGCLVILCRSATIPLTLLILVDGVSCTRLGCWVSGGPSVTADCPIFWLVLPVNSSYFFNRGIGTAGKDLEAAENRGLIESLIVVAVTLEGCRQPWALPPPPQSPRLPYTEVWVDVGATVGVKIFGVTGLGLAEDWAKVLGPLPFPLPFWKNPLPFSPLSCPPLFIFPFPE